MQDETRGRVPSGWPGFVTALQEQRQITTWILDTKQGELVLITMLPFQLVLTTSPRLTKLNATDFPCVVCHIYCEGPL